MFKPPIRNGAAAEPGAPAAAVPSGVQMLMRSLGIDPQQAIGALAESAARLEAARLDFAARLDRIEAAIGESHRRQAAAIEELTAEVQSWKPKQKR